MKTMRMDQRGRVTIPLEVRRALRLQPGQMLRYQVEQGKVVITPATRTEDLVGSLAKHAKRGLDDDWETVRAGGIRGWAEAAMNDER